MKTIKEWCKEIAGAPGHIMKTDQETICLYQDAIGHSCEEDLTEIANNTALNETFYRIYGFAYGTCEAIKFYLNHSEKITNIIYEKEEAEAKLEKANEEIERMRNVLVEANIEKGKLLNDFNVMKCERDSINADLKKAQEENIILKAKLYDLMNK